MALVYILLVVNLLVTGRLLWVMTPKLPALRPPLPPVREADFKGPRGDDIRGMV